jgi:hypothetical protein
MKKENFTRNRKLPFTKLLLTIAKKSVKSIQNVLNETQIQLSKLLGEELDTISNSAYSKARSKLNFTAFKQLANDSSRLFYGDDDYKKYKHFRLLAVDGSTLTLPNNDDIKKVFSTCKVVNQHKHKMKHIVKTRISVLYDVLNNISVDACMSDYSMGEISIFKQNHLEYVTKDDLIIFDRGYPSYDMFATIIHKYNANFLVRTKRNVYKEISFLFDKDSIITDTVITLKPSTKKLREELINDNLPCELKVRFVQVILDDGEVEVLATSVLDGDTISTNEFKALYFKRWGIETYYEILKNRLSLENFTGLSTNSILQDFYATIFISNLESILTDNINEQLKEKTNIKYTQKVNKSVSFNIIKNYCFELFYSNKDIEVIIEEMSKLFLTNKVPIRPNRKFKRPTVRDGKNTKGIKSANYQKRNKKIVF